MQLDLDMKTFVAGRRLVGAGIDLVRIPEFVESVLERASTLEVVFTANELEDCDAANRIERLAARFAAKEAAFKAVGTGWARGVTWHDAEVVTSTSGAPELRVVGALLEYARARGGTGFDVSLTHSGNYAAAVVLLLSE